MIDAFNVPLDELRFTVPEILSLIGITQCVYVFVYIGLRARRISRAGLPFLYFLVLGCAFFLDFARDYIGQDLGHYDLWLWFAWFYGPPLSLLLIIQIGQVTKMPALRHYWVLLLPILAFYTARFLSNEVNNFEDILVVAGLISGALSLLAIWLNRRLFKTVYKHKTGQERYWLILALIGVNVAFLSCMLMSLNPDFEANNVVLIRTVLGLGCAYLVGTSLFRIYPQAVLVEKRAENRLSDPEFALVKKIEALLILDKVYQEASYSRTDLARECDVSETAISRIINAHFGRSFPQLMNEYRVEDAKRLLNETDAPVKIVAQDVGFNSLASFNRVFKDISGQSPSQFRKAEA